MFNDVQITISGNLTADPEIRFTPPGTPVATVRVAHTPRRLDRKTNTWVDGTTTFLRCEVWDAADNVAKSLRRGDRVIVIGRLRTETFTPQTGDSAGQAVTVHKVIVDEIGPSLRWAVAKPRRNQRTNAEAEGAVESGFDATGDGDTDEDVEVVDAA